MFEKIKNVIKRFKIVIIIAFIVIIVSIVLASCSSIGDNNRVQFGLTNEAVSGTQVKDDGYMVIRRE